MTTKSVGANSTQLPNVSDQCVPEGAQVIQLNAATFDGTGTITYTFNTDSVNFKKPSTIRTLYFDARAVTGGDVLVAFQGGPTLRIPFGKQGYIPIFMPCPANLTITSTAGNGPLNLALHNFKVYPYQW